MMPILVLLVIAFVVVIGFLLIGNAGPDRVIRRRIVERPARVRRRRVVTEEVDDLE